jgi:tetratricopeptide (TPR) repeat protein
LVLQPNTVQAGRQEVEQLVSTGDSKLVIYRDLRAAEGCYEKALLRVQALNDPKLQARVWGRIGNLRRVMAKDLSRPEQARISYEYFSKAQELAHKLQDREAEGRILADWSLLYLDNGQIQAAQQALQGATLFAPQDAQVNVDFAVYLYKMQLYPDMQKYIEKALFLDPSNWQALWYKVKLAEMFGDPIVQRDTLKDIIKFYPWSKLAKDKLAGLTAPPVVPGANPSTTSAPANIQQPGGSLPAQPPSIVPSYSNNQHPQPGH